MPLYEYQCQKCGHIDEYLMKFSDPDPHDCQKCHGPVAKKVSQTSFALKGDGWYVTDYKAKPEAQKSEVTTAEATPAVGGSEAAGGDSSGKQAKTGDSAPAAPKAGDASGKAASGGGSVAGASASSSSSPSSSSSSSSNQSQGSSGSSQSTP